MTYKDGTVVEVIEDGTATTASAPLNIGYSEYITNVEGSPDPLAGAATNIAFKITSVSGSLTCGNFDDGVSTDLVTQAEGTALIALGVGFVNGVTATFQGDEINIITALPGDELTPWLSANGG